jgi:ABC-type transporter Mla subunit MlaD
MLEQFSPWTLVLIGIITLLTVYFHFFHYSSKTAELAPNILTSIGIFGTFLGVALGLWSFDTTDIHGSVPKLMDGLKTAFWSSIAGLLGALTIKLRSTFSQAGRRTATQTRAASIDDLDASLKILADQFNHQSDDSVQALLKRQHEDNQNGVRQIVYVLEHYEERMADANAKALVEAIEAVMQDFNARINEQYGDNFKRLNESVGKMLDWQNNYRAQLQQLIDEQERTASSMKEASNAFEYMVKHANAFNGISESLQDLLNGMEAQRANLEDQLGGLATVVNNAAEGLPQLEERIGALTTGIAKQVHEQQRWTVEHITNAQEGIQQQMSEVMEKSGAQLVQQQQLTHQQLTRIAEKVERQVAVLDDSMEEELNKALQSFGMQLTALSEKFVSDYSPLTQKLQDVVKLAEEIRSTESSN